MPKRITCTLCPLHRTCKTVQVRGRGFDRPKILIVGEAPGAEEDNVGQAFVGQSGKLLESTLQRLGCPPWRVTNSVRCRPPENRKPSPAERKACLPYLEDEIAALDPELIVALGDTALQSLLEERGVMKLGGKVIEKSIAGKVRRVLVAAHPSYVMRVPEYMPTWESHLAVVRGAAREVLPNVRYRFLSSLEEIRSVLRRMRRECPKPVAFDFETTGLDPYKCELRTVAVCNDEREAYCFEIGPDKIAERVVLGDFLRDVPLIAHHSTFEWAWVLHHLKVPPRIVGDTKAYARLVNENDTSSLKPLLLRHTDMGPYDAELDGPVESASLSKLWRYNCADADGTLRMYHKYQTEEPGLSELHARTVRHAGVLSRMRDRGMLVDRTVLQRVLPEIEREADDVVKECGQLAVVKALISEQGAPFNPNATKQVSRLLFDMLGLRATAFSKKTKLPSTASLSLKRIASQHPLVELLLKYRKKAQLLKNFLRPLDGLLDKHGVVHPDWNLYGTDTWRISCGAPNLQNLPDPEKSDPRVRACFIPRPGHVFVQADYSQMELRVLAAVTEEPLFLDAFKRGIDIHTAAAAKLFNVPVQGVTELQRKRGKTLNFGCVYGISEYGLERQFEIPMADGLKLLDSYWAAVPKVREWMDEQEDHVERHGYVTSPFGHRRNLPPPPEILARENPRLYSALDARRKRQGGNAPVQGAAGQITLDAMVLLEQALLSDSYIVAQIHDAILCEAPVAQAQEVARILRDTMLAAKPSWMGDVPLAVEVEVGVQWEKMAAADFGEEEDDDGEE